MKKFVQLWGVIIGWDLMIWDLMGFMVMLIFGISFIFFFRGKNAFGSCKRMQTYIFIIIEWAYFERVDCWIQIGIKKSESQEKKKKKRSID